MTNSATAATNRLMQLTYVLICLSVATFNMLHTWMACTVFRGSYWELPLRPVGSVISLTDDSEVISYIEENNGLITIRYESALFYSSCNSKCMLPKASAILLLCPEFKETIIYDSSFLCREQLTEFIWGTNSPNNGFPVIQKARTTTYFINVFTAYADLPTYLRIPHYIPNQFCYTICSHVQACLLITVKTRSPVTSVQIAAIYEHYVE
jgi:hypothetical protein